MNVKEIADVLEVSTILQQPHDSASELIAALIDWRDGTRVAVEQDGVITVDTVKPKRGKAKAEVPDDSFEATPDPSADEPDF